MADQENINNTRRQNELLDAQFSTLEALNRLAQQRVVFEGEVSDEIANENDFLRQQLIVRNNLNKGGIRQLTTQKELNKAANQNLGIARSIQNVTASELGSQKLIEKTQNNQVKVQGNINFLKKQSLEIDKQQKSLLERFDKLKSLEKKAIEDANKAEAQGDKEKANNLKSRAANLGLEAKSYQAQIENNNAIVDSLDQQVKLGNKLLKELDIVERSSKAIANDGFLSIFDTLKKIVNIIPGMRELLPGFDQAAESYREALVLQESLGAKGIGGEKGTKIDGLGVDQAGSLNDKIKAYREGDAEGTKGMTQDFIKDLPKEIQDTLKGTTGTSALAILSNKFKDGVATSVSPLTAAFTALQKFLKNFILLQFLNAMVKADKVAGDLAKSMNVTYQEGVQIQDNLNSIANTTNSIFVTSEKLAQTQMFFNKELGTSVMLTDEQLATMTKLREAAGFTNEELAGIAKISITTGKEAEKITGEVLAQARISATRLGVVVNERDIVKEIAKVSAATTLSLGKSEKAIADAVTTAKALGFELSQIEGIASSILQFESSIENELSAELLIGKELNLDRARFAALNNEVATVAKEISSQIGTAAEFGKMSRIQQEALAKAVGMNREELAQTLYVQEQLAGVSGDEAKRREKILNARIAEVGLAQAQQEMADEGFETLEHQASVQERLIALTEKLGEVFVTLAEPILAIVSPIVDALAPALSFVGNLVGGIAKGFGEVLKFVSPLVVMWGTFMAISKTILAIQTAFNTVKAIGLALQGQELTIAQARSVVATKNFLKDIGSYAIKAAKAVAGIPVVGPFLAVGEAAAAVAGGMALYSRFNKADDLMSSPTGGSGYGDRILVSKEGTYALNNRDTIQASTVNSSPQSAAVVETKLYIDNEAFAQASSKSFSKL